MKITIILDEERYKRFLMLLIRLCEGDFTVRIPEEGIEDDFQVFEVFGNRAAESLQQMFSRTLHFNPTSKRGFGLLFSLDLNPDFIIVNSYYGTTELLGYEYKELVGKHLHEFLSKLGKLTWADYQSEFRRLFTPLPDVVLHFLSHEGLEIPVYCYVTEIRNNPGYAYRLTSMVSSFREGFTSRLEEDDDPKSYIKNKSRGALAVMERPEDLRIVYQVRDEVIRLSEGPLPSMSILASKFGTNASKLRYDFKEYTGFTPVQLHANIRFTKAKVLIETVTSLPLSEVAERFGFVNYSSFATSFKAMFGYRPGMARKRARSLK